MLNAFVVFYRSRVTRFYTFDVRLRAFFSTGRFAAIYGVPSSGVFDYSVLVGLVITGWKVKKQIFIHVTHVAQIDNENVRRQGQTSILYRRENVRPKRLSVGQKISNNGNFNVVSLQWIPIGSSI